MYQISRAIYRELAPSLGSATTNTGPKRSGTQCAREREQLLHSCEAVIERLAKDPYCFADPTRTLFADIRPLFSMDQQLRVHGVVSFYMEIAERFIAEHPIAGYIAVCGEAPRCRATTRKGDACRRIPLPVNGYCPSHQHLAESEDANWRTLRLRKRTRATTNARHELAPGMPDGHDEVGLRRLESELQELVREEQRSERVSAERLIAV